MEVGSKLSVNRGIIVGPGAHVEGGATVINSGNEMNNTFNGPVSGVVAQTASDFQQIHQDGPSATDMEKLVQELGTLRAAARRAAVDPEHDSAVGALGEAQIAAQKDDREAVSRNLARAGTWALDIATKVGTSLAAEALKHSLGI